MHMDCELWLSAGADRQRECGWEGGGWKFRTGSEGWRGNMNMMVRNFYSCQHEDIPTYIFFH